MELIIITNKVMCQLKTKKKPTHLCSENSIKFDQSIIVLKPTDNPIFNCASLNVYNRTI